MKVKELIQELKKQDQNLEVAIYLTYDKQPCLYDGYMEVENHWGRNILALMTGSECSSSNPGEL